MICHGTNRGIHYWLSWFDCPRRRLLVEKLRTKGIETTTPEQDLGTVLHHYLQEYYLPGSSGAPLPVSGSIVLDKDAPEWPIVNAIRVFTSYKMLHQATEFGDVEGTEVRFGEKKEELTSLYDTFKVTLTGEIDMIVNLSSWEQCAAIEEGRKVVVCPGWYIVDHKTTRGFYPGWEAQYIHSLQLQAYMMAAEIVWPERQWNGAIVNAISVGSRVETRTLVLPLPTQDQRKFLVNALATARERRDFVTKNIHPAEPSPLRCFWPKPCKFLASLACEGYSWEELHLLVNPLESRR